MLFYDFEVFKYDWLVVIMDTDLKKETVIVNSVDELQAFYDKNISNIWVGFNSRHYDQYILKGILCGFDAKKSTILSSQREIPDGNSAVCSEKFR